MPEAGETIDVMNRLARALFDSVLFIVGYCLISCIFIGVFSALIIGPVELLMLNITEFTFAVAALDIAVLILAIYLFRSKRLRAFFDEFSPKKIWAQMKRS